MKKVKTTWNNGMGPKISRRDYEHGLTMSISVTEIQPSPSCTMEMTQSTQENGKPSKVSHRSSQWQQALWKPISKHNRFSQYCFTLRLDTQLLIYIEMGTTT
jgi:hypothetical protein